MVWYVSTREDVAGFKATLRNTSGSVIVEEDVPYDKREHVFRSLEAEEVYQLCFKAVDSLGTEREGYESQCIEVGPVGRGGMVETQPIYFVMTVLIGLIVPLVKFYL